MYVCRSSRVHGRKCARKEIKEACTCPERWDTKLNAPRDGTLSCDMPREMGHQVVICPERRDTKVDALRDGTLR